MPSTLNRTNKHAARQYRHDPRLETPRQRGMRTSTQRHLHQRLVLSISSRAWPTATARESARAPRDALSMLGSEGSAQRVARCDAKAALCAQTSTRNHADRQPGGRELCDAGMSEIVDADRIGETGFEPATARPPAGSVEVPWGRKPLYLGVLCMPKYAKILWKWYTNGTRTLLSGRPIRGSGG